MGSRIVLLNTIMFCILDYIQLIIFQKLVSIGKKKGDARWSAFLFSGLYLSFLIWTILALVGLVFENPISSILKADHAPYFGILCVVITALLLAIRYYWITDVYNIERKFDNKSEIEKKVIRISALLLIIVIPVMTFLLSRLYIIRN